MLERLKYPSIPVPKEDLKSINETVLTLKRAVEMLTGQGEGEAYASHVFVQSGTPEASHVGDMWVCNSSPSTLNVWMNGRWIKILDLDVSSAAVPEPTPTRAAAPQGELNLQLFSRRQRR